MAKQVCPLIKDECLEHGCKWYIQVLGKSPQTGADISAYDCTVNWLPFLLIEGTQQTRQAGAAIESFRNEMVKINEAETKAAALLLQMRGAPGGLTHAPDLDALPNLNRA